MKRKNPKRILERRIQNKDNSEHGKWKEDSSEKDKCEKYNSGNEQSETVHFWT